MRRQLLLLAPAGMLLGHTVGYLLASSSGHHGAAAAHAHVALIAALAAPLAVAALALSALRHRATAGRRGLLSLTALQAVAYVSMEVLERVASGLAVSAAAADPAVVAGLISQLVVAAVLVAVDRGARCAGRVLADARRRAVPVAPSDRADLVFSRTARVPPCRATRVIPLRRGPPALLLSR